MIGSLGFVEMAFLFLIINGAVAYGLYRICTQAGYPGFSIVFMFLPIVNLIAMAVFAFAEWPATRELQRLRSFERACTCQPEMKSVFPHPGT